LQIAFIAAVRPSDLNKGWAHLTFANDFGPLAAIATILGLGWLAVLLYIDAIVSPADTGLIYTTVTGRVSYAMGRNGNAPRVLAKTTRRGVPLVSLFVTFVVGLIVFLPFPSWQQLVGFVTSATVLSFGAGTLVVGALRRELPERERPFRVPGGDVLPFLAFYASNLIVYWAGWDVNWKLFVTIALGFVLLAIFHVTGKGDTPPLDWRSGATWTLPWLGGMALMSWLGAYPEPSEHAGNRDAIGFGWGFLVILALTAVIYVLAMRMRLPRARVEANIEHTKAEVEAEESELTTGH
jgi:amino acid transporter